MSCVSRIRRSRRLTLSNSTANVLRSNVNVGIGFKSLPRIANELTLFVNSADRNSDDKASLFRVNIPDGPTFPVNTSVRYQMFQMNLPCYIYYFDNEAVTYTFTASSTTYSITKTLNGFYDMSEYTPGTEPGSYSNENLVPDANFITYVYYAGSSSVQHLAYDKRSGRLFNNRSTPITITVSSERGRIAFGMPEGVYTYTLAGNPIKSPDDGSITYDERYKKEKNGSYIFNVSNGVTWKFDDYAMPYPMQQMPSCLYVRLHETLETTYETAAPQYNTNTMRSDILAQIPVNAQHGGIITYLNADTFYEVPLKAECREFYIGLYDEFNQLVNLHGFDWQCVLRVFWSQEDQGAR